MARFIPCEGSMYEVCTLLELGDLQKFVGGLVRFIAIGFGDNIVCHEDALSIYPENITASSLYHQPIHGPAVVQQMKELL
jgi:hypothetical protein